MESTLTNFEKLHPPQKENSPSTFIDFMNIFHPPRLLQPPRLHYLIFSAPFFTVYKQFNDSFLTEMKLIQEIRLELVSLDPFLLCKYVLRWFLKKKSTLHAKIHPPRLLIFQKNSNLHGYSNLHVY